MLQHAGGTKGLRADFVGSWRRNIRTESGDLSARQKAVFRDPLPCSCERHPHEPAAPFNGTPHEGGHDAKSQRIATEIIDGGNR